MLALPALGIFFSFMVTWLLPHFTQVPGSSHRLLAIFILSLYLLFLLHVLFPDIVYLITCPMNLRSKT